jgi:hypothetical protein
MTRKVLVNAYEKKFDSEATFSMNVSSIVINVYIK